MQSTPKRVLFYAFRQQPVKKIYFSCIYQKKVVPLQRKLFKTHNYEKNPIILCHRSTGTRHGIL